MEEKVQVGKKVVSRINRKCINKKISSRNLKIIKIFCPINIS